MNRTLGFFAIMHWVPKIKMIMGRTENGLYFMRRIPESFAGKCNWKMIKLVKRLRMLGNVIFVHVLGNSVACRFVHFLPKLSYIVSLSYSL
jgi:hypothetical protein